jgi:hypothetical protein
MTPEQEADALAVAHLDYLLETKQTVMTMIHREKEPTITKSDGLWALCLGISGCLLLIVACIVAVVAPELYFWVAGIGFVVLSVLFLSKIVTLR